MVTISNEMIVALLNHTKSVEDIAKETGLNTKEINKQIAEAFNSETRKNEIYAQMEKAYGFVKNGKKEEYLNDHSNMTKNWNEGNYLSAAKDWCKGVYHTYQYNRMPDTYKDAQTQEAGIGQVLVATGLIGTAAIMFSSCKVPEGPETSEDKTKKSTNTLPKKDTIANDMAYVDYLMSKRKAYFDSILKDMKTNNDTLKDINKASEKESLSSENESISKFKKLPKEQQIEFLNILEKKEEYKEIYEKLKKEISEE